MQEILRIPDIKKLRKFGDNKVYEFMHKLPCINDGMLGVYVEDYEEYCNKEREEAKKKINNNENTNTENCYIRKLNYKNERS